MSLVIKKELNNLIVELLAMLVVYRLPLANWFVFNYSFLILSDLITNNTLIVLLYTIVYLLIIYDFVFYKYLFCIEVVLYYYILVLVL